MTHLAHPTDLDQAIRLFSDADIATEYAAGLRWPHGWACPHCGGRDYSYISTRRLWKCKSCARQSSVKVGTILEGSALGLDKWLPAIWLVANPQEAVSSHELARALGTTQKSAWFMLHRIREAVTPADVAPAAPIDSPGELDEASHQGIRLASGPRPRLLAALALLVFGLGVAVGRLTSRFT